MSKYTVEMVEELVTEYGAVKDASEEERNAVIEAFASAYGVSVQSVRMKLVREGVYVAKVRAKRANSGQKLDRETLLTSLREKTGAELRSLERASLKDLEVLLYF
jgi:hypothetical protein